MHLVTSWPSARPNRPRWRFVSHAVSAIKYLPHLLHPWQIGGFDELVRRHRRRVARNHQPFHDVRRQVGQPHHAADKAVCEAFGLRKIVNRGDLTGFEPPPPRTIRAAVLRLPPSPQFMGPRPRSCFSRNSLERRLRSRARTFDGELLKISGQPPASMGAADWQLSLLLAPFFHRQGGRLLRCTTARFSSRH